MVKHTYLVNQRINKPELTKNNYPKQGIQNAKENLTYETKEAQNKTY